jgi:hypothetical protein
MGFLSKYRIQTISNSTEIGTASPKITQQNLNFPLSNLRSPFYAHIAKSPDSREGVKGTDREGEGVT